MKSAPGPLGRMSMGGLVTILKVRDNLPSYDEDPGWYQHPTGTVALKASGDELRRDGIEMNDRAPDIGGRSKPTTQNGHHGH